MKKYKVFFTLLLLIPQALIAQELHGSWLKFFGGNTYNAPYELVFWDGVSINNKGLMIVGDIQGSFTRDFNTHPCDTTLRLPYIAYLDSNKNIAWYKVLSATQGGIVKIIALPDSNFLIVGNLDTLDTVANNILWLLKVDKQGNTIWDKRFSGRGALDAISVTATADKGFAVLTCANYQGGIVPYHYGHWDTFDGIVLKVDSLGNFQWVQVLGGTDDDFDLIGSIVSIGNFIYAVSVSGSKDHDFVDTAWYHNPNKGANGYVIKLDLSGNKIWSKSYGGSGSVNGGDGFYKAIVDPRDSTIIGIGTTFSNDYMVSNPKYPKEDNWIMKIDTNGNYKWSKCYMPVVYWNGPNHAAIINTPEGYMMTGSAYVKTKDTIYGFYMFISMIDTAGNVINIKRFGNNGGWQDAYCTLPYLGGYAVLGDLDTTDYRGSYPPFAEGTILNNMIRSGGVSIYKLDLWQLGIQPPNATTRVPHLYVYPNPVQNELHIQIKGTEKGFLTIYGMDGKKVFQQAVSPNTSLEVPTLNWQKGHYVVLWQSENGEKESIKIILQ